MKELPPKLKDRTPLDAAGFLVIDPLGAELKPYLQELVARVSVDDEASIVPLWTKVLRSYFGEIFPQVEDEKLDEVWTLAQSMDQLANELAKRDLATTELESDAILELRKRTAGFSDDVYLEAYNHAISSFN